MSVRNLRIQLQSVCPELKNLTDKDLSDCKWSTKKIVFTELLSTSLFPLFYKQSQDIDSLNDNHNQTLSKHKMNSNVSKDAILEYEQIYKTSFLNIVIDGLKIIKWPPAIEPFANLLEPMFNDKQVFMDAVEYIVRKLSNTSNVRQSTSSSPRVRSIQADDTSKAKNISPRSKSDIDSNAVTIVQNSVIPAPDLLSPKDSSSSTSNNLTAATFSLVKVSDNNNISSNNTNSSSHCKDSVYTSHIIEVLQYQNQLLAKRVNMLRQCLIKRTTVEARMTNIFNDINNELASVLHSDDSSDTVTQEPLGNTVSESKSPISSSSLLKLKNKMLSMEKIWERCLKDSNQAMMESFSMPMEYCHELNNSSNDIKSSESNPSKKSAYISSSSLYTSNNNNNNNAYTNSSTTTKSNIKKGANKSNTPDTSSASSRIAVLSDTSKLLIRNVLGIASPCHRVNHNLVSEENSRFMLMTLQDTKFSQDKSNEHLESEQSSISINITKLHQIMSDLHKLANSTRNLINLDNSNNCTDPNNERRFKDKGSSQNYPPDPPQNKKVNSSVKVKNITRKTKPEFSTAFDPVDSSLKGDTRNIGNMQSLVVFNSSGNSNTSSAVDDESYVDKNTIPVQQPLSNDQGTGAASFQSLYDPFPTNILSSTSLKLLETIVNQTDQLYVHLSCYAPLTSIYENERELFNAYTKGAAAVVGCESESSLDEDDKLSKGSSSALDTLIIEIEKYFQTKKAPHDVQVRFQKLCDQSKAEQLATIRVKLATSSRLQSYLAHGHAFSVLMEEFFSRITLQASKQLREIDKNSDCLKQLLYVLDKAEKSRLSAVNISPVDNTEKGHIDENNDYDENHDRTAADEFNQHSYQKKVSHSHHQHISMPMDALARGFLGSDVAELINSLRFYKEEVEVYLSHLNDFLGTFKVMFQKELSYLKAAKDQIFSTLSSS